MCVKVSRPIDPEADKAKHHCLAAYISVMTRRALKEIRAAKAEWGERLAAAQTLSLIHI